MQNMENFVAVMMNMMKKKNRPAVFLLFHFYINAFGVIKIHYVCVCARAFVIVHSGLKKGVKAEQQEGANRPFS